MDQAILETIADLMNKWMSEKSITYRYLLYIFLLYMYIYIYINIYIYIYIYIHVYKHYIYAIGYILSISAEGRRKGRKCGKLAVGGFWTLET